MALEAFIGIDYGTSSCKLAYATVPLGDFTKLPSIDNISFSIEGIETSYRYPSSVLFLKKRKDNYDIKLGFDAIKYLSDQKELNKYQHFIVKSPKLDLGKGIFYPFASAEYSEPMELVYLTLKNLLHEFEQIGIKKKNTRILLTVPSSFGVQQRGEIINSLKKLNIDVDSNSLIDEPNAAILGMITDPLFSTAIRRTNKNKILIIDYGAGTCDISLLEIKEDFSNQPFGISIQNLAINDYREFGGNIIDQSLAELIIPQLLDQEQSSLFENDDFVRQIAYEKIALELSVLITKKKKEEIIQSYLRSQNQSKRKDEFVFRIEPIKFFMNQLKREFSIARNNKVIIKKDDFYEIISDLIYNYSTYSIEGLVENVLSKADVSLAEIGAVLFVGGSSRIFQVQEFQELLIENVFIGLKKDQLLFPKDPDLLISKGAAIECYNRYYLSKSLIRPICPSTIGIKTAEDEFIPLIEGGRGLPIPNHEDHLNTVTLYAPNVVKKENVMQIPLYIKRFGNLIPFEIWAVSLPPHISPNEMLLFDAKMDIDKILKVSFRSYKNPTDLFGKSCNNYLSNEEPTKREIKINELRLKIKEQKKNTNNINSDDLYDLVLYERNSNKHRNTAKLRCMQFLELDCFNTYENANLYNVLGLIADSEGDHFSAIRYYKKSTSLWPRNSVFNFNIGVSYLWYTEEYSNAEIYLIESIKYNPNSYLAHYYLGNAKIKMGKENETKEEYRIALEFVQKEFQNSPTKQTINIYASICDYLGLTYTQELKDKILRMPSSPEDELDKISSLGDNNIIRANPEIKNETIDEEE
jgi:molecular chaperone DnaK (HSP70)